MSFVLRHKIRTSANLLSQVSPSRLTEELLKIINSGHSYQIVKNALKTDLYIYLQPSATALMYANKEYEKKYLEKLKELDALHIIEPNARLGQKLVYLIQDFILNLTNWKMEVETNNNSGELYAKTWQQCRHFVLPMNPQRTELEYAIKYSLKKIGVKLKNPKKTQSKQTNPKTNKQVKK